MMTSMTIGGRVVKPSFKKCFNTHWHFSLCTLPLQVSGCFSISRCCRNPQQTPGTLGRGWDIARAERLRKPFAVSLGLQARAHISIVSRVPVRTHRNWPWRCTVGLQGRRKGKQLLSYSWLLPIKLASSIHPLGDFWLVPDWASSRLILFCSALVPPIWMLKLLKHYFTAPELLLFTDTEFKLNRQNIDMKL